MKLQLASDLHLEFLQRNWPQERLLTPAPGADLLVLAGDIHHSDCAMQLFADWPVPVIAIAGNHEFYGQTIEPTYDQLRASAHATGIHFLECNRLDIGGVRFLGATFWTDYRLRSHRTQSELMDIAQSGLNDHRLIHSGGALFSAQDALERHEATRAWLQRELAKPFAGKTVVISHHGPHPLSVHHRYAGDTISAAFCSDLSDLMPGVDLWLHGHTHDSFDYTVPGTPCRVVANPAGYIKNRHFKHAGDAWQFENPAFNTGLLIKV